MPSSVKTCWIKVQLDTTWIGSRRATPPTDTCFIVKLSRPCKGDKESQLIASYLGKMHRLSLIAQLIKNLLTKKKKKESASNAGDPSSIPESGRSPGEGIGYPLQYSDLEKSMDCAVHEVAKSRTCLSDFHFHFREDACLEYQL